jgi:hypothetical protein
MTAHLLLATLHQEIDKTRVALTVDSAHLLGNHDGRSTIVSTTDAGHAEAVPETGEVASTCGLLQFLLVDDVRVVEVTGGDDGMSAEARHGAEALGVLVVLHEPTGRLRAEEDADGEDEGGNEGRAQLQAPRHGTGVLDDDVGGETEENADDDPELPEHDEGTADTMGSHLGRINGDGGILRANANAHDESRDEELLPRPGETRGDGGGCKAEGSDENLTTSAQVVIQRIDNEGAAAEFVSRFENECALGERAHMRSMRGNEKKNQDSHETGRQEDNRVDDTDEPLIALIILLGNAQGIGKAQVGAIGTGLIPTLGGSTGSAQSNGVPEHEGAMPLVVALVDESGAFVLEQLGDGLEAVEVAGYKRSAAEKLGVLWHSLGDGPLLGIDDILLWGVALAAVLVGKRARYVAELRAKLP